MIEIKRFRKGSFTGWISKANEFVRFPLTLDLALASVCDEAAEAERTLYQCCGVVNHHGGYGGGHYTAYVRDPLKGTTYLADDDYIQQVDPIAMLDSQAYLLLYRRAPG